MTWLLNISIVYKTAYIWIETKFAFSITMKDKPVNEFLNEEFNLSIYM